MSKDEKPWIIAFPNEKTKKRVVAVYESSEQMKKCWISFERDVTANPFFHAKPKRIEELKEPSFPKGTYRYRKDPIRVVYYPSRERRTVYPLECARADDVSYKRKSSKRSSIKKLDL
jgi:mRNA-degrading endonuclease RelE of RelBE toxin-antitoxin system